jgi:hypothetical protein
MSILRSHWARAHLLVGTMVLAASLAGCEPGNPNEAEYLEHTPPGKPPENPDETASERRARTLRVPKKVSANKTSGKPVSTKGP